MKEAHGEEERKFKGGRLRKGDAATRLMEEEGKIWRDLCIVCKITKEFIICEIKMASVAEGSDTMQQIVFDRKTGVNIKGIDYGWLKSPKKPANKDKKHTKKGER
jgi:hypothetical protein